LDAFGASKSLYGSERKWLRATAFALKNFFSQGNQAVFKKFWSQAHPKRSMARIDLSDAYKSAPVWEEAR
jgi:hypothetical protein